MRSLWVALVVLSFAGIIGFLVSEMISTQRGEELSVETTAPEFAVKPASANTVRTSKPLKPDLMPAALERETQETLKQTIEAHEQEQRRVKVERTLTDSLISPEFLNEDSFKELSIEERLLVIREELDLLPQGEEAAATRVALLNAASQLDETEEDVLEIRDLALKEFYDSAEWSADARPTEGFEQFLPLLAHQVYLKTASDELEALSVTMDGMLLHTDPIIRQMLYRQFVNKFPQSEDDFRDELVAESISVVESVDRSEPR